MKRILVMSPHVDDGEIGCGGSIAKYLEDGAEVFYLAFSDARISLSKEWPPDTLVREVKEATACLGIPRENVRILDFRTRNFPAQRQEILDNIINIRDELKPNIIFTPSRRDVHQDHQTITWEVLRAFKRGDFTILGYEEPWNCFTFDTTAFIPLDDRHIKTKIDALDRYKSQKTRGYVTSQSVEGLAKTRGTQIGMPFAESFEVLRLVMR